MSDRILGVIGLTLALFYAVSAASIQESFMTDTVGPKTFPYIISAVIALTSLVFLFKPDPEPAWPKFNRMAEVGFAVAVTLLYAWVLPELGFLISTALAAGYLSWRLGSHPLAAVAVGIGTSVGIFVVFRLILGLSLAKGPFGF